MNKSRSRVGLEILFLINFRKIIFLFVNYWIELVFRDDVCETNCYPFTIQTLETRSEKEITCSLNTHFLGCSAKI